MKIRIPLVIFAAILLGSIGARGAEVKWLTDFHAAVDLAKSTHKNILINFTGSDWCPECKIMDKEVFATPQFHDYAEKHLVLMQADYPQAKQLPQKVQDQNVELQKAYGVEVMPTLILVDKNGKVLGRQLGNLPGEPAAIIEKIKSFEK